MAASGYSGTPLAKKLGFRDGSQVYFENIPQSVRDEIESYGAEIRENVEPFDIVHFFTSSRDALEARLPRLMEQIAQNGMIWVSWPKKASKVSTSVTEDVIRAVALPMGLVDVKICSVDAVWSGLKLVIRKELRR
jgi:hypothetical protein